MVGLFLLLAASDPDRHDRFDVKLSSAEDLGAKPLRCFLDIELPLLMPGISGAGIFSFLLSFNELLRSTFLRGSETTMPVYNWAMASAQQSQVPIGILALDPHPGHHTAPDGRPVFHPVRAQVTCAPDACS